jgi:hypothetical protein
MTFLPFEKFEIESSLSKEKVIIALMENIEEEKMIRFWKRSDAKDFEGTIRGNEFEIQRIISYKNSFLPIIKGRMETAGYGAKLRIDMRIQIPVILFLVIWFGIIGLFFIIEIFKGINDVKSILFPFGMLLFGYILTMAGYLVEASKAKDLLLDITQGKIIKV